MTGARLRQVVLDTETTGLEVSKGHRIIEIGCVELVNRRKTERSFHTYLNPERDVEQGAFNVHGISLEQLQDKPRFSEIVEDFLDFVRGSELIIHNAPFDVEFINAELQQAGHAPGLLQDCCRITDSLVLARELHPGQKNSLDALCNRYRVDNSQRDVHGALLDAGILADVYLAMTGGQTSLQLDDEIRHSDSARLENRRFDGRVRSLRKIRPTTEEVKAHQLRLESIEKASDLGCLWRRMDQK